MRPKILAGVVVAAATLALPVRLDAQQANPGARDPYRDLFRAEQSLKVQAALEEAKAAQVAARKPRVVCGMVLIPADPGIDPKMAITPPSKQVRPTIRAIDPPVCNSTPR